MGRGPWQTRRAVSSLNHQMNERRVGGRGARAGPKGLADPPPRASALRVAGAQAGGALLGARVAGTQERPCSEPWAEQTA